MDEVAENSDELMERYLEGEEISPRRDRQRAQGRHQPRHIFPVTCGVATENLGTDRLLDALVDDLPSPVKHGGARAATEHDARARRGRRAGRLRLQDASPTRSPGRINLFRVYQGVDEARLAGDQHARPQQGAHRPAARAPGQGDRARRRVRRRRHRRGREAEGDALRRLARRQGRPISFPPIELPGAGDGVRDRAQVEGRRGEGLHRAAPAPGGGPDARLPPRPADRRADHRRPLAGARRGDRRPHEAPLRRRGRPSSRRASPTRRRSASRRRPRAATRSRPAAAASSATATSRSSRCARRRLRVRQQDQGRRDPRQFIPAVEKGVREAMQQGVVAGYPVGVARHALRRLATTPSTPRRWRSRSAGSIAFKKAAEQARPTCSSRSCRLRSRCPRTPWAT